MRGGGLGGNGRFPQIESSSRAAIAAARASRRHLKKERVGKHGFPTGASEASDGIGDDWNEAKS